MFLLGWYLLAAKVDKTFLTDEIKLQTTVLHPPWFPWPPVLCDELAAGVGAEDGFEFGLEPGFELGLEFGLEFGFGFGLGFPTIDNEFIFRVNF